MRSVHLLLTALPNVLALTSATPVLTRQTNDTQNGGIQWGPCKAKWNVSAPIDCANLTVPLDYTNPSSNQTLVLDILRLPASKQPAKGSIFFNTGGPGASGVQDLGFIGANLLGFTGGEHDILNIVPRGTGDTLPFNCFASDAEATIYNLQFPSPSGEESNVALGNLWATAKVFSDTCYRNANATGSYVGTVFTARDIMSVVDALGEDGLIRYYGISYGTTLGATLAALFPDRLDKVVLDGVVNSHEYFKVIDQELFASTDDVFHGFCAGCVAARENCSLAQNFTAYQLEETLYGLFETLKYNPIPVSSASGSILVDYTLVKSIILNQLYYPQSWPDLAYILALVLSGNTTALANLASASSGAAPPPPYSTSLFGIKCGDRIPRYDSLGQILPEIISRHQRSRFGDQADFQPIYCGRWQMKAKETYNGDFQVKTRNPILFIGNTYDPVTPLVSARNMSSGFDGSVVLQHDGYGHCALLTQASACTASASRAYFSNGTLPTPGTICDVEVPLFSGETGWEEVFSQFN